MKMKLLKLLLLFFTVLFSCIAIIWFSPLDKLNYLAIIKDKHRLLKTTTCPRIIFVGGSNLAFGLDSSLIKKELGYNVVNMSLHGGLGIKYMANEIERYINEGDIIVIVPEYDFILIGGHTLLEILLFFPEGFHYIDDFWQYKKIIEDSPITLQRRFNGYFKYLLHLKKINNSNPVYNKNSFNQYGDVIGHLKQPRKQLLKGKLYFPGHPQKWEKLKKMISFLNQFHTYMVKKKAEVFFSFPPVPESYYRHFKPRVKKVYKLIKSKLKFSVLGEPEHFVYPDNYFFDTIYHLNERGRRTRTLTLVKALSKVLNHKKTSSGTTYP